MTQKVIALRGRLLGEGEARNEEEEDYGGIQVSSKLLRVPDGTKHTGDEDWANDRRVQRASRSEAGGVRDGWLEAQRVHAPPEKDLPEEVRVASEVLFGVGFQSSLHSATRWTAHPNTLVVDRALRMLAGFPEILLLVTNGLYAEPDGKHQIGRAHV